MFRSARLLVLSAATAMAMSSCKSTTTETTPPVLTATVSKSTLTITQGKQDSLNATVNVTGDLTGTVAVTVVGAPDGATGIVRSSSTTGTVTTANIVITVASTTAPGTYNIVVHGNTSGATEASVGFTLVVVQAPAYFLSLGATSVPIVQALTATEPIILTRRNFTGPINLTVDGLPTGVTGTFDTPAALGSAATLTLTATSAAPAGTATVTVHTTTDTLGAQSATFQLVVGATPAYALSVSPTSTSVIRGAPGTITVNLDRTNFTGSVNLVAEGVPSGVNASFSQPAPTGATSTLTLATTSATPTGTFTVTVRGTVAGMADRTATFTFSIGASITVDFSLCSASDRPAWFAYQDGTGAWTRVVGVGDVYQFPLLNSTGAIAYVDPLSASSFLTVQYSTAAELTASTIRPCTPPVPATIQMTGTFAHVDDQAFAFYGGSQAFRANDGVFTMTGIPTGTFDLLAFTSEERGYIVRAIPAVASGTFGTVDFRGANSFDALTANGTISNSTTGEGFSVSERYFTGVAPNACVALPLNQLNTFGTSIELFGVPPAKQLATDMYQLFVQGTSGGVSHSVSESFHDFTTRVAAPFVLPTPMTIPTVNNITAAAPYKRLNSVFSASPSEYNDKSFFGYSNSSGSVTKFVNLFISAAARGNGTFTLAMPDFSAVPGWSNAWAPATTDAVNWSASLSGTTGAPCMLGAKQFASSTAGTR